MGRRGLVEFVSVKSPSGPDPRQVGAKAIVVMAFQEMDHFVDEDVIEAGQGFLLSDIAVEGREVVDEFEEPVLGAELASSRKSGLSPACGCASISFQRSQFLRGFDRGVARAPSLVSGDSNWIVEETTG